MFKRRGVRILIYLLFLPIFLGAGFTGGVLVDHFLISPSIASAKSATQTNGLDLFNQAYQIVQQKYVDRSAVQQTSLNTVLSVGWLTHWGIPVTAAFYPLRWSRKRITSPRDLLKASGLK